MSKLALFYHCRLGGGTPPINAEHAIGIMQSQMQALISSGLSKRADHFVIGSNGDFVNYLAARSMAPDGAKVINHGENARSELPTLALLRKWLPSHSDWYVLYHHTKGAGHWNHGPFFGHQWRICMEKAVIWNWRACVDDLNAGYDAVGAHWLTRARYGQSMGPTKTPYFGGTFWWAKAEFLLRLPAIPDNAGPATFGHDDDRFLAEKWIGLGPTPKVRDYAPHWPNPKNCNKSAK